MQFAASEIIYPPLEEGGAFRGRSFVAERPISAEIPIQVAQVANAVPRQSSGGSLMAGRQSLLPEHNAAGLDSHARGHIELESEDFSGAVGRPTLVEPCSEILEFRQGGANIF